MVQHCDYKAVSRSANQEILWILEYPGMYYRVHKNKPLGPILRQLNPVHTFTPLF